MRFKLDENLPVTTERTQVGREVEAALGEVLAHVRGETVLPCQIVDDPSAKHILALRKRMKLSRQKFADRFGLDVRAVQDWEQGRRVLLTVIARDPKAAGANPVEALRNEWHAESTAIRSDSVSRRVDGSE